MKRVVQLLAVPLMLTSAVAPVSSRSLNVSLFGSLSSAIEARALAPRALTTGYTISRFSGRGVVEAFRRAWNRSGHGTLSHEGLVLVLRMADGSFGAREMGATNEYKMFTFRWHPGTVAVVHTHPNTSDPRPQDHDISLADKQLVPVFTITNRGMYVYDPHTRKTSVVMHNLDWLDQKKWEDQRLARP